MDINEPCAQLFEHNELHRQVIHIGPRLTRRGNHSSDGRGGRPLQVVLLKELLQAVGLHVKLRLNHTVAPTLFEGCNVGPIAQHKAQSTQQDTLTGTRLTCDNIQAGAQCHIEPLNECIVFNGQVAKHNRGMEN